MKKINWFIELRKMTDDESVERLKKLSSLVDKDKREAYSNECKEYVYKKLNYVEEEAASVEEDKESPEVTKQKKVNNLIRKQHIVESYVRQGYSLTNIFTKMEDVKKDEALDIMTHDFLKKLSQGRPNFIKMWARWYEKNLK